jgi:RNA polymerase sigma-70 factor (ECF subfamily)
MEKITNSEVPESGALSDDEIISRVIKGEKNLYGLIVRRYNQRLYRIAMSIVNDDSEAEDIMQVAYINAYENIEKFAFRSAFSTWLTRILINESLLRVKKKKNPVPLTDDMIVSPSNRQNSNEPETPVSLALQSELKTILEKSIQQLPEKYRTVFIMREIEGLNVAETQECLDITEVNVKVRLNRARSLLKERLSAFYKIEEILSFHLSRCDRVVENVLTHINH